MRKATYHVCYITPATSENAFRSFSDRKEAWAHICKTLNEGTVGTFRNGRKAGPAEVKAAKVTTEFSRFLESDYVVLELSDGKPVVTKRGRDGVSI